MYIHIYVCVCVCVSLNRGYKSLISAVKHAFTKVNYRSLIAYHLPNKKHIYPRRYLWTVFERGTSPYSDSGVSAFAKVLAYRHSANTNC